MFVLAPLLVTLVAANAVRSISPVLNTHSRPATEPEKNPGRLQFRLDEGDSGNESSKSKYFF